MRDILLEELEYGKKLLMNHLKKSIQIIPEALVKSYLLREKEENEIIKGKIEKGKEKILSLQITLTDYCNLKCSYCYNHGNIEQVAIKNKFRYIKKLIKHIKHYGTDMINIIYTGGEPLAKYTDLIEYIIYFKKLSVRYNLKLNTLVITNGLLITEKKILELKKLGVYNYQLTLDSTEGKSLRRNSSYNLNPILDILDSIDDIHILLRVNINKFNYQGIYNSLDYIASNYRKVYISFERIYPTNSSNKNEYIDYFNVLPDYILNLYKKSKTLKLPSYLSYYDMFSHECSLDSPFFYSFFYNGSISKCPYIRGEYGSSRQITNKCKKCKFFTLCDRNCSFKVKNEYEKLGEIYCDSGYNQKIINYIKESIL